MEIDVKGSSNIVDVACIIGDCVVGLKFIVNSLCWKRYFAREKE